jgi:hypothetical protein
MNDVGKWRARGYWVVACGLLPLLNPIALALISLDADNGGPSWVVTAICIAVVNGLLLALVAVAIWKRPEAVRWRVATGLVLAVALSVPYGFGELLLILDIACPAHGCLE